MDEGTQQILEQELADRRQRVQDLNNSIKAILNQANHLLAERNKLNVEIEAYETLHAKLAGPVAGADGDSAGDKPAGDGAGLELRQD